MASVASISFGNENRGFQIGDNHGSIHAEIHPHERPETPPSPLSTVPFPRDPDFVEDRAGRPWRSRIALVGLGGVRKSQLAIEYSYQVRSVSPATWVFWVHASNEARFEQSFRDIADQLKLPGLRDPRANVFQLVENWLRDEKKGRWICVLDNVDDGFLRSIPAARKDDRMEGSTNAPTKPLLDYIPRNPNGSTVITSRSREIALSMVNHKDLVEVKPMERSEALDLLQKKLDQPGGSQESQSLVEALEFMPLAIIQAASFIRNRAPRYSGLWDEAEQLEVQVMETRKTKLGEDHPDTLTSMANLALTYSNQGRWDEAEQLQVQLMETRKTKLGEDHPDMLTSMANLALTYSNQGRWDEAEQLDVQGRWDEAEQLDVQVMETSKTKLGEDHPDTLTSMGNLASTYWNQGRWDEAEQLFVQVMEMSKTKLGEDHPDTLASMANLAFSWKSSAHDVEAIVLLRECLIKQKQTLGQNHPTTLSNSRTLLECETEPLETEGEWETDEEWETDREFL
ncbi:hypothetical protein E8E15_000324 [Penicillium rubens]|nr:hypothetical protein E8E15_000324 [Penicillium rubens]